MRAVTVTRLVTRLLHPQTLHYARRASPLHTSAFAGLAPSPSIREEQVVAGAESLETSKSVPPKRSLFDRWFSREAMTSSQTFTDNGTRNRWLMALPAFSIHSCIGSPWGWSVMTLPLAREFGFVGASSGDWTLFQATLPMTTAFALQGISAAGVAKWQLKVGGRFAMMCASFFFGGGLVLGSAGIYLHNLPMLLIGYGLCAGTGKGMAYTPPVQALINWFPDRKGLASAMVIAGFGSGGMFFAFSATRLLKYFSKMPQFLGADVPTVLENGRMMAEVSGKSVEVVQASAQELAKLGHSLSEGYYVVGSGSTGAAATLATLGAIYFCVMFGSAFAIKYPADGFVPTGFVPPTAAEAGMTAMSNVTVDSCMRTPQFYQLAGVFFCIATGGMGLMSVAKVMMGDVFSGALPAIVTSAFASTYVVAMSASNLTGRFAWAFVSDIIGRRNVFHIFTLGSIPLYLSIPSLVSWTITSPGVGPLVAFMGSTMLAITCMGATYAVLPAYEADLFGSKYVQPIHGRMLMASTMAGLTGPTLLLTLRKMSETRSLNNLLTNVDPDRFQEAFHLPLSRAQELIDTHVVTINKLMQILPKETVDPTPFIYNSTMYTMAGVMALASGFHMMVKPVNEKFFER